MAYEVIATAEFEEILSEAVAFRIDNYGLRSARRLLDDIDRLSDLLAENPLLGRVVDDKSDDTGPRALRWIRTNSYIALYRVHEHHKEVALLKLFAATSNWRRRVLTKV